MKINKISKKLIKPHTPTPQNLKTHNISFVDQFIQPIHIAVILFYQPKLENHSRLEESLAKTLVDFYPLAGRCIKNDLIIDCSDAGVEFIEAEAEDVELIDLVSKAEADQLNAFLPDQYFRCDEAGADVPLLSIQATRFHSGGAAIAVSVSHRVSDVSSLGLFVAAWSNAAANIPYKTPNFHVLPSFLPYWDLDLGWYEFDLNAHEVLVKRLVFDKTALARLRSEIMFTPLYGSAPEVNNGAGATTISGVRVVCAVIAKAMIRVDRARHGKSRNLVMFQAINMRERTIPPQPKQACGNFAFASQPWRVAAGEAEAIGIRELVDRTGDTLRKSITEYAGILSPGGRETVMKGFERVTKEVSIADTNVLTFTDWSRFGFYEADFGWGKPVWACIGPTKPGVSTAMLMSDKEGSGIEAWLHLNKNDMRCFEQDEEMKMFTI